ncbi:MAG TPA: filamentous hemagglutinin N-terminal domain-containing protein [Nostoc sp.]|uniref:two-partner secretion domain-containing protein n=1 Tax=Nostoc sp. TaxID=1180 RepID=UPI002D625A0D|nr:filamentous hemagglutinin N-terminal domain-containing protein [Nostoc sp.]HYX13529.1 filamentous hemagglutinin N-terminal domain-containing protein [Nostoc sp.]
MFSQSLFYQWLQLRLVSLLALVAAIAGANECALAQIVPDNTLEENSIVTPLAPNFDRIDGGTPRGANLFHSFEQFNVKEGGRALFFINPSAGIKNIISRVTGGNRSEIFGTLGVFGGSANLFLINPNGIIFGPNAQLTIGGSFLATTANAIGFGEQGLFSASAPNSPPVLTINPSALLFNQIAKSITNQSTAGLQLSANQSLLLVGGDVNLEGGKLSVLNGRVELGGLAGEGTVGLNIDDKNLRLSFPDNVVLADVSLTKGATVETGFGRGRGSQLGTGDIQVQGRRVTITDGSQILANNTGAEPGGTLTVRASELVEVLGASRLLAETSGVGTGGNLTIDTGKLIIRDGSEIAAGTFNSGRGGTVTVRASDSVELSGTSADGANFSSIITQTDGAGNAGSVSIETGQLIVQGGALVSTASAKTSSGQGGLLFVKASDSVQLIGTSTSADNPIPSGLFALGEGSGKPGDLTIETRLFIARDGARASASNLGSAQSGGTLSVTASESVQLIGTSANGQDRSGLLVGSTGTGSAGELTIKTEKLQVLDGAFVSARTAGEGRGGSVTVNASNSIELNGTSADRQMPTLLTTETTGVGDAGNLTIETGQLTIKNGAQITSNSTGLGRAGDSKVQTSSLSLDQGSITSQTTSGNGGNITLSVEDLLLLRRGSKISTSAGTAQQGGDGGSIDIKSKFIVAIPEENSDISANAFSGAGGRVNIKANGIYGIKFRESPTRLSDITASSEFGRQGTVELNTPGIDPNSGLVELPTIGVETEVVQVCDSPGYAQSSFIITGRGGLPPNPSKDILPSGTVEVGWVSLKPRSDANGGLRLRSNPPVTTRAVTTTTAEGIVEASGWAVNEKGEVVLTANVPAGDRGSWQKHIACSATHAHQ